MKDWAYLVRTNNVVGTTFKETIEEGGNQLEMTGEITRYEKDRAIAFHLNSSIHELVVAYQLEEAKQGTTVCIDADVRWKFPMSVISLFAGGKMKRSLEEQLRQESLKLKQLCEG